MANSSFLSKRRRDQDSQPACYPKRKIQRLEKSMKVDRSEVYQNGKTHAASGSKNVMTRLSQPMQLNESGRKEKSSLFNARSLRTALIPTLEIINRNDPKMFRQNFIGIKKKLVADEYSEPWDYVEDVWSMFERIWLSHPKTSPVYRNCTKSSKVFEQEIDLVMQSLGYCCGRKYKFGPQKLCCSEKELCTIPIHANYFDYRRSPLFVRSVWPDGFVCDSCLTMKGSMRKENKFTAKNLPKTNLDIHIETRVNEFLKKNKINTGQLHIRMLFNSDETVKVQPEMRKLFVESGDLDAEFPYRSKAIFAFQETDGVDLFLFGMYVQEYGSESASPNQRRVYITFLDSVYFYQPAQYRTSIYQEILLGYFDYVKQLGYTMVHIWVCPPPLGQNYIFYSHPKNQKRPDSARLQNWYRNILRNGKREQIVVDFKNILQQAKADKLSSAAQLPYFDGDFWPNFFEKTIKDDIKDSHLKIKRNGRKCERSIRRSEGKKKSVRAGRITERTDVLRSKLFTEMENNNGAFFAVRLHLVESAADLDPIIDPDAVMFSNLMNGHNAFFGFARDHNYEFSSLRRAQFSTLCILYELHNVDRRFYICNNCNCGLEVRFHCRICDDFDLCEGCKDKIGHVHEMHRLGSNKESSPNDVAPDVEIAQIDLLKTNSEARKPSAESLLQMLEHGFFCHDHACRISLCQKIKSTLLHANSCDQANDGCRTCRHLKTILLHHAKNCQNVDCPLSFCRSIKAGHQRRQQHPQRIEKEKQRQITVSVHRILSNFVSNEDAFHGGLSDASIGLSRVQILIQELIKMRNASVTPKKTVADATVPNESAQCNQFVETVEIL